MRTLPVLLLPLFPPLYGCLYEGDSVADYDPDGDGVPMVDDCDSQDPLLGPPGTWYRDGDADGWGAENPTVTACHMPEGYAANMDDCDDNNWRIHPGTMDWNDGVDNNCDGQDDGQDAAKAFARFLGEAENDDAGRAVAAAGDVNGDGYADLLVGVPGYSEKAEQAGAAALILGPTSGSLELSAADIWLVGTDPLQSAGYSVAGLGDIDGDGAADMAVGAPAVGGYGVDAGGVYLVFGGEAGLPAGHVTLDNVGLFLAGEAGGDGAGLAVAGPGDVTGNGAPDVLVGAPYQDASGSLAGVVYVVEGGGDPMQGLGSAYSRITGESGDDQAGTSVAGAGDVNGDGQADLVLGAAFQDPAGRAFAGAAYLVLGPVPEGTWALNTGRDQPCYGASAGDYAGWSVAGAGDSNDDGYDDLLVGAPFTNDQDYDEGRVYLLLGSSGELPTTLAAADATISGRNKSDHLGTVAWAGDVDNDGFTDLAMAAPDADDGSNDAGAWYLFCGPVSGNPALDLAAAQGTGPSKGAWAGESLAGVGDVNGDGYPDLLLGAPGALVAGDAAGAAYLLPGGAR